MIQNHTIKLVMTKTLFKWEYSNTPKHKLQTFVDKNKRKQQKAEIEKQLEKKPFPKNIPQRWTNIVTATPEAAENALGIISK